MVCTCGYTCREREIFVRLISYRDELEYSLSEANQQLDYLETEIIINKFNEFEGDYLKMDKTNKETWKFLAKLLNNIGYGVDGFNFIDIDNRYYIIFNPSNLLIYGDETNSFAMKYLSEYNEYFQYKIFDYIEDKPDIYEQLGISEDEETDCDRELRVKNELAGNVRVQFNGITMYIKKELVIAKEFVECDDKIWRPFDTSKN